MTIDLTEDERQIVLLALARLSLDRPGWDNAINEIARKMDNICVGGRSELYERFRELGLEKSI